MTPEEKLDRQRDKWRRAKARRRKRARDAEWQRTTNGFIVELEVRRSLRFLEFLVRHGFLANEDAHIQARIEEATDKFLRSLVVNLLFWDPDEDLGSGGGPCRIRARIDAKVIDNLVRYELIQEDARINLRWTVDKGPRRKVDPIFAENLRSNPAKLKLVAEDLIQRASLPQFPKDPVQHPPPIVVGLIGRQAPPQSRPRAVKPLKPKVPGWHWSKRQDDELIRSHDRSAGVGMEGRFAGAKGAWKNPEAPYYPEADSRASTRDWNATQREAEKALRKPYDDPTGVPKSWGIRSDAEPDDGQACW